MISFLNTSRNTLNLILFNNLRNTKIYPTLTQNARLFSESSPQRPPSFFGKFFDNLKEEAARNKKLKENLKDFRKDMDDLEKSEALLKARQKFKTVEEETAEGTKKAKQQIESLKQKVKDTVEEAQKTEILQKASRVTEEASKRAQRMGETLSQKGEEISKTQAYKAISDTARIVKKEIDDSAFGQRGRAYVSPEMLKMRLERDPDAENKVIEANAQATGITLHKDSKFSQSWQDFKNNNPYVNRVLEWRSKIDESDNPLVRASFFIKDKATELFGGVFQQTELSEALTEICKMDPSFDKERFLLECEYFIIPNILEATIRPDLKVLQDWCYDGAYQRLAVTLKAAENLGYKHDSKILDVDNVDLVMGKVMDQGPVLALSFSSQQILCIKNQKGEVIEGDPSKVIRGQYVWMLCRDQSELNPQAAWRLLDLSANYTEQFV